MLKGSFADRLRRPRRLLRPKASAPRAISEAATVRNLCSDYFERHTAMTRPAVAPPAAVWTLSHPLGLAARCVVCRGDDDSWNLVIELDRRLISQRYSSRRTAMRRATNLVKVLMAGGLKAGPVRDS